VKKTSIALTGTALVLGLALACSAGNDPPLTGTVTIDIDLDGIPLDAPEPGARLTVDTGGLGGDGEISFQWRRGNANIFPRANPGDPPNPSNGVYFVRDEDLGHAITVVVSRSGHSGAIVSAPTPDVIQGIPPHGVEVTPDLIDLAQGESFASFSARVTAQDGTDDGVRQAVVWSVESGQGAIDGDGRLTLDADAPIGSQVIVRATAIGTDLYGTAIANVTAPAVTPPPQPPPPQTPLSPDLLFSEGPPRTLDVTNQILFDEIAWYVNGGRVSGAAISGVRGGTLDLDLVLDPTGGPHTVRVDATIDGATLSRTIRVR